MQRTPNRIAKTHSENHLRRDLVRNPHSRSEEEEEEENHIQWHSLNSIITATDSVLVPSSFSLSFAVSVSAFRSLFVSLFLLLIDLRLQRIESHSIKTLMSRATDSKSHRKNTFKKFVAAASGHGHTCRKEIFLQICYKNTMHGAPLQ
jgi:hypothetical protein